jgi:hypothetical protein
MAEQPRGQLREYVSDSIDGPYFRLAKGITSLAGNMNPQTKTNTYIDDFSSTVTTGFQPTWPVDGNIYTGDKANELLYKKAWEMAKGDAAQVYYIRAKRWEPGDGLGSYAAKRFLCNFAPASDGGGAGGEDNTFSGELQGRGEPTFGEVVITRDPITGVETCVFTANDQ